MPFETTTSMRDKRGHDARVRRVLGEDKLRALNKKARNMVAQRIYQDVMGQDFPGQLVKGESTPEDAQSIISLLGIPRGVLADILSRGY